MQDVQAKRPRAKAHDRGEWKLAVYFKTHNSQTGKAYYFYSNKSQDRLNISANRFKRLVTGKWNGKVNWAGLYQNDVLLSEFKEENGLWETRSES